MYPKDIGSLTALNDKAEIDALSEGSSLVS